MKANALPLLIIASHLQDVQPLVIVVSAAKCKFNYWFACTERTTPSDHYVNGGTVSQGMAHCVITAEYKVCFTDEVHLRGHGLVR